MSVYDRMTRMIIVIYNVGDYAREKEALLMLVRALLLEINQSSKVLYETTVNYAPWLRYLQVTILLLRVWIADGSLK